MPAVAFAAWVAVETFDSYSDGDLNGNNGGSGFSAAWSGDTDYDIQGTVTFQSSTKAVKATDANGNISRALTSSVSSGVVYVAMRADSINNDQDAQIDFLIGASTAFRLSFRDQGGTDKAIFIGSSNTTILEPLGLSAWYVWKVTFNGTTADVVLYNDSGSQVGSASSLGYGTTGDIDTIRLNSGGGQVVYWDYISPTDPFAAPAVRKSILRMVWAFWL